MYPLYPLYPFWALVSKLDFGPFWPILVHFGPFRSISVHLGLPRQRHLDLKKRKPAFLVFKEVGTLPRNFAEILVAQLDRSCKVAGRPGLWTKDRYGEARRSTELGMQGNLEVAPDKDSSDVQLVHEKVDGSMRGLSVFALPKLVRFVTRSTFGPQLVQCDFVNSHLRVIWEQLAPATRLLYPAFARLVLSREEVFAELRAELNCSPNDDLAKRAQEYLKGCGRSGPYGRDEVKVLCLAVTYGCSIDGFLQKRAPRYDTRPALLYALGADVKGIAHHFALLHPANVAKIRGWGKVAPEISNLAYLAASWQRAHVERMRAVVNPDFVASEERDGFALYCPTGCPNGLAEAAGIPVTREEYPAESALVAFARAKYPYLDFEAKSVVPYRTLFHARRACVASLRAVEKGGTISNITDFGFVIAARVEPFVFVSNTDSVEYYDITQSSFGYWQVTSKEKALKKLVRQALLDEFRDVYAQREDGGKILFVRGGKVPPYCKRTEFRNKVTEDAALVLLRVPRTFLDGEHTRPFIMDRDGMIYDFARDTFIPGCSALRISRHVPFSFGPLPDASWDAPPAYKRELASLLDEIFDFYLRGDGPGGKCLDSDPVFGAVLADRFRKLIKTGPAMSYWAVMLAVYKDSVEEVVWKTCHLAASASGYMRRCEFIYEYGEGSSGKDTSHIIALNFFGSRPGGGLSSALPGTWFTDKHVVAHDSPGVHLDAVRSMRYVSNNEIPAHRWFNTDALKPLCEHEGTWIMSRGLYAQLEPWRSMAGLQLTSNFPIVLTDEQCADSGFGRRLNFAKMPRVFTPKEQKDIKGPINRGVLNHEVFWIVRRFFPYLAAQTTSQILPRPPRIVRETSELLTHRVSTIIRSFLAEHSAPAIYVEAAKIPEFTNFMMTKFVLTENEWTSLQVRVGLVKKQTGMAGRRYAFIFAGESKPQGIKLLESAADAPSGM
jgi:hypothetical protein